MLIRLKKVLPLFLMILFTGCVTGGDGSDLDVEEKKLVTTADVAERITTSGKLSDEQKSALIELGRITSVQRETYEVEAAKIRSLILPALMNAEAGFDRLQKLGQRMEALDQQMTRNRIGCSIRTAPRRCLRGRVMACAY